MKADIHPQYHQDITVTCSSCGNTFKTGSTRGSFTVDVCYKCHPFFTGEHRFLDTKGRAEEFTKKQEAAKAYKATAKAKRAKKSGDKEEKTPKTLRELLTEG